MAYDAKGRSWSESVSVQNEFETVLSVDVDDELIRFRSTCTRSYKAKGGKQVLPTCVTINFCVFACEEGHPDEWPPSSIFLQIPTSSQKKVISFSGSLKRLCRNVPKNGTCCMTVSFGVQTNALSHSTRVFKIPAPKEPLGETLDRLCDVCDYSFDL